MMTPQTVMRESEERGEEKDVEGSTSTNVLVKDVIDTIKHVARAKSANFVTV